MTALESKFKRDVTEELRGLFPGCFITKLDAGDYQGVPDMLILFGSRWAVLEFKRGARSKRQPNQELYINRMNKMSFGSFISPENKEEVLDALKQAFRN